MAIAFEQPKSDFTFKIPNIYVIQDRFEVIKGVFVKISIFQRSG